MGILIDTLAQKYALQTPPLEVASGVRQTSNLDPVSQLAFNDASEADLTIEGMLDTREREVLTQLQGVCNARLFHFPLLPAEAATLMPHLEYELRESVLANIVATAASALEEFVLGDLFLKASDRNPEIYLARAMFYLGDQTQNKTGSAARTLGKSLAALQSLFAATATPQGKSNQLRASHFVREIVTEGEYR